MIPASAVQMYGNLVDFDRELVPSFLQELLRAEPGNIDELSISGPFITNLLVAVSVQEHNFTL